MENNITKMIFLTDEEAAQALARRLRTWRKERGLTQAALAERAGLSPMTVNKFERSGRAALPTVVAVVRALNLLGEFDALFAMPEASPLDLHRASRKRGRSARVKGT
ncbi:MAG TPA: helix-turn-helix transcriptional regulator [Brevundimonas sp.]|nr:helix-turn-helix transcriptional regulator [Brevundimonas sp.]